ncbi:diguanylate cyclase [Butyrivibrio sp. CB08]|uniref:GGDEF domain-containing protein n=1 Tax=Butyrivibrio sp. CB08 TaxID=2364879 RepID=UPI000EA85DE8|nr:GGDEF domain-containing protein [Butyrivibrio sp. CB08]RKM58816.1 diguanylate cyclase [Butyrivibrio sp. CB08]
MRKTLSLIFFSAMMILVFLYGSHVFFSFTPEHMLYKLERGWTVSYHNQQYLNTNLEKLGDELETKFAKGDTIVLHYSKPLMDLNVDTPYLFFKTSFCSYEVYLDGELIAEQYTDIAKNHFVGISYYGVALPTDYAGKKLSIVLTVIENETNGNLINPVIGDYDDIYRDLLHTAIFPFFTGCFLLIFGMVFFVLSLIFYMGSPGVANQLFCSVLTVILGAWILTAFDIVDLVISSTLSTTIEYASTYLIAPCIYLIIYDLHKRQNNKILIIMGFATLGFSILFMALHFSNIVHFNHFEGPYYLISSVGFILLLTYGYIDLKSKSKNSSLIVTMVGLTLLSLSLLVYSVISILGKVADYRQSPILTVLIPTGALLFVIMQLLNYFIFMTHSFARKKEYAALTKIAYIDNLTGLPNRVSFDEKMVEFDKSEDDFCLLSLDLNGLKSVNDNSGHPAGDRLLRSFAHALAEIFDNIGTCARIGGDEFVVLIKDIDSFTLDGLLNKLDTELVALDKLDTEINHSVSYGYAFRHETEEKDTHTVLMLADKRMYSYKKQHYAHMMTRR